MRSKLDQQIGDWALGLFFGAIAFAVIAHA